jgi:hypothetical protein
MELKKCPICGSSDFKKELSAILAWYSFSILLTGPFSPPYFFTCEKLACSLLYPFILGF